MNKWQILKTMTEKDLFQYLKTYFTDIVDLNLDNQTSPIDWYIPSYNLYIEAKCRYEVYPTYWIEKDKYDKLISVENSWYLNSTPTGIYYWDTKTIDPIFYERKMTNTQQFGEQKLVDKLVADLLISKSMQIDHLFLRE